MYLVSLDEPERNREFAESLGARHVVLSDPGGEVAKAYGVTSAGGLHARRWTFYIDAEGRIREIDKAVTVETAGQDIVDTLGRLGVAKRPEAGTPGP